MKEGLPFLGPSSSEGRPCTSYFEQNRNGEDLCSLPNVAPQRTRETGWALWGSIIHEGDMDFGIQLQGFTDPRGPWKSLTQPNSHVSGISQTSPPIRLGWCVRRSVPRAQGTRILHPRNAPASHLTPVSFPRPPQVLPTNRTPHRYLSKHRRDIVGLRVALESHKDPDR